jgi:hypothetical protein
MAKLDSKDHLIYRAAAIETTKTKNARILPAVELHER